MKPLPCFKAYDVRGRVGVDLDEDAFERIGWAGGRYFGEPMRNGGAKSGGIFFSAAGARLGRGRLFRL